MYIVMVLQLFQLSTKMLQRWNEHMITMIYVSKDELNVL
jgi:hypothetical protein